MEIIPLDVLPTRVGMVRCATPLQGFGQCSPHACGDGPQRCSSGLRHRRFSPRVWGWSDFTYLQNYGQSVLPTRVGMVRSRKTSSADSRRSPHACGDGPPTAQIGMPLGLFSPRVWGWSGISESLRNRCGVLPTRVGMVRKNTMQIKAYVRSPHACGDGPQIGLSSVLLVLFSPRVWGWSELKLALES